MLEASATGRRCYRAGLLQRRRCSMLRKAAGTVCAALLLSVLLSHTALQAAADDVAQTTEATANAACPLPVTSLAQRLRRHQHHEQSQSCQQEDSGDNIGPEAHTGRSSGNRQDAALEAAAAALPCAYSEEGLADPGPGTKVRQLARSVLGTLQRMRASVTAAKAAALESDQAAPAGTPAAAGATGVRPLGAAGAEGSGNGSQTDQQSDQQRQQQRQHSMQQALATAVHLAEQAAEPETLASANVSGPPLWNMSPVSREWAGHWRRWQQDAGSSASGNATMALPALDDSVRCRSSGICSGAKACSAGGDSLGCITDTAVRQQRVREAAAWAWRGYRQWAWGEDELRPVSKQGLQWMRLGLTIVDSLDTLLLMGLDEQYAEARHWVAHSMLLHQNVSVNLFETTIRVLGGLQSAFLLSGGDRLFLLRAVDLALRMSAAFNTSSGIPWSDVNLGTGAAAGPAWSPLSSLSEAGTLALEWGTLDRMSGRDDFGQLAARAVDAIIGLNATDGLPPFLLDPTTGAAADSAPISLGARGDSYVEYLLKAWLASGKRNSTLLSEYKRAMQGVRQRLLARSAADGLLFVAELGPPAAEAGASDNSDAGGDSSAAAAAAAAGAEEEGVQNEAAGAAGGGEAAANAVEAAAGSGEEAGSGTRRPKTPKMDHLVCFLPGTLALGHLHGINTGGEGEMDDLEVAEDLMATCNEMYARMPAGLAPEIAFFRTAPGTFDFPKAHPPDAGGADLYVKSQDAHNLLRPETLESLFVLWRVTRRKAYREQAWAIFRAFEKHCRVDSGGYAGLDSVLAVPPAKRDRMESFWLAESLKYLWLLFSDDETLLPLDQWVFNTEAHPLPISGSAADTQFSGHYVHWRDVAASHAAREADSGSGSGGGGGNGTDSDGSSIDGCGRSGDSDNEDLPACSSCSAEAQDHADSGASSADVLAEGACTVTTGAAVDSLPGEQPAEQLGRCVSTAASDSSCGEQAQQQDAQVHQREARETQPRRRGLQHPLLAYISAWRARRAAAAAAAAAAEAAEGPLISERPAGVNGDIAMCEAELVALLRREQSGKAG